MPPEEQPVVVPTDEDAFADAFAEATEVAPAAPAPEAPPAAPAPAAEGEVATEGEVASEVATEPEPEAPTTLAEELRLMREEMRAAATAKAEPEPEPVVEPAPESQEFAFSPDEQAALTAFEADWPEISTASALRMRENNFKVVTHIFNEVQKYLNPYIKTLNQLNEQAVTSDEDAHIAAITSAHSDYDAVFDDVQAWIKEQSPARQRAFKAVAEEGTAEEVIDLISVYKEVKGLKPAPTVVSSPAIAPAAPPATNKAVQRLTAVPSRRAATSTAGDPNDFDGAFAEFAAK